MTFLAPGFFFASLAVAAAVVALHFIVTRQPRAAVLPTARFVPDLPATATARATRPSDLLLMLLRVLLVLAIGTALARPVLKPSRNATARVILVDASQSAVDMKAVRDSAVGYYRDGDAVIVFDSTARIVGGKGGDSLRSIESNGGKGRLSGALISALRAGSSLRDRADSIELVVVSPLASDEFDAATDSIRALWAGRARVAKAGGSQIAAATPEAVELKTASGDPLAVTVSRIAPVFGATRIVRAGLGADDMQWAAAGARSLIDWPVSGRPRGASPRAKPDTIGGVVAGDALVVATFPRQWVYAPDSIHGARVVARFTDGEPAAVEWTEGSGCVRSVAVPVNPVGDFPLRPGFARFVTALASGCASQRASSVATSAQVSSLTGNGGLAPRDAFEPRGDVRSALAPWLFGLAIVVAIAELFVRRRRHAVVRAATRESSRVGRAA